MLKILVPNYLISPSCRIVQALKGSIEVEAYRCRTGSPDAANIGRLIHAPNSTARARKTQQGGGSAYNGPMKYSLRSLMIGITVVAIGFAACRWVYLPSLRISQPIVDLGELRVGAEGVHSFLIQNNGWHPVHIRPAECSNRCGFDAPRIGETMMVPSGKSREVKVRWRTFDTALKTKEVQWKLLLETSDPRQPEIRFVLKGRFP